MSSPTAADVDAHIKSLINALERKSQDLADARTSLRSSENRWRHMAEGDLAHAVDTADKALTRDRKSIAANIDELHSSALGVAMTALERRAPGFLSADWNERVWTELPTARAGEWVRVGTARLGSDTVPIALPLSAGAWSVVSADADAFKVFVHNVIARVVTAFDPSRVRVLAYDPDLTLDLACFAGLRAISATSVPPAITSEDDFDRAIEMLRTDLAAVDDRLTAAGQGDYWSALTGGHSLASTTPLRLLIIGSSTDQLSDRARARLLQVRKLAADRGLLVIESVEAAPRDEAGPDISIVLARDSATTSALPSIRWTPDAGASERMTRALSANLVGRPRPSLAPKVEFKNIVAAIDDPWMVQADEGLEGVIGTVDGGELVLRLRSENPPMPNVLIGGAVGQGKSNLLLVLIHSLAAKYSPAEMEMVLVDLRDGVEFARLGPRKANPTWLPHVRALGLEFDPDFSIAVLRWVTEQMIQRSGMLKDSSASTLRQYHLNTGRVIPRLVVVIDEFQRLFEGDSDQAAEAATLLENIARTGRGFGVHLVLASQAISGIQALGTRGDAIFGQFHNRLTLRNTAAESQAFLAAQNLAATTLEHRGQVVLNDSLGAPDANTIGTVAFADAEYLEQLQLQLFQQGHGSAPAVFRASSFAAWPSAAAVPLAPQGVSTAVGLPIAIESAPRRLVMMRSPNQALVVVGSDREIAIAVLVRAVTCALDSLGAGARITILDGDSPGEAGREWISALVDYIVQRGMLVERVGRQRVAARIVELAQGGGAVDLVVAIALDSVDLSTPIEPDYLLPNESLRDLLRNGPLAGTWTIGWWQALSVLEEHLGLRAPGVRAWAFAGVSHDDLTSVAGHAVRAPTTRPRFIWFDRTAGVPAERLVPFAADDIVGAVDLA